ncbi:50S ribosomal protein L14e [Candidatus Woesearchaeota archaeon]|nr:50S ribosomal protein L14e [Candidatus Woesearchaeota archaeon]
MEIGRLCVKTAGRDADGLCVVVDVLDKNLVMIDGNVRRRKCNVMHLEPLDEVLKIKKGASHSEVASEFKKLKLDVWEKKAKKKAVRQASKPRKVKAKEVPAEKAVNAEKSKSEKKEAKEKPKKK